MLPLLAMLTLLVGDIWYAYLAAAETYTAGHPVDVFWWASYVLFAALVVNPRADELTRPTPQSAVPRLSRGRLLLLGATTLAAPATLAVRSATTLDPELKQRWEDDCQCIWRTQQTHITLYDDPELGYRVVRRSTSLLLL